MAAYYNEHDHFAANWLRGLIHKGLIADGEVDERSIVDVKAEDLKGFTQCHFFAGIGGWSYAARLARWADSRPMWTGSPPCQPFSTAGQQKGEEDERHLWPVWFDLIRQLRPTTIFGEQVSAAVNQGWLDQVQSDLESSDYACGAIIIPASAVGALHKRSRLWFVANSISERSQGRLSGREDEKRKAECGHSGRCSSISRLADSSDIGHEWSEKTGWEAQWRSKHASNNSLGNTFSKSSKRHTGGFFAEETQSSNKRGKDGDLLNGHTDASEICSVANSDGSGQHPNGWSIQQEDRHNPWGSCQTVRCKDGKVRAIPTEPSLFPLAHGIPNRVGILRCSGNAIVPQVAAQIIKVMR
ncbi:MAG: hypothetical protein CBD88_07285 [Flavobacteriales bacterium TMED228]|nr:MAG: hypothetical protein CBD88_07285 [Flavobacteriales bacterium TMED228]